MMKRMDLIFLRKDRLFHAPWLAFVLLLGLLLGAGNSFGQNGGLLSQKITYKTTKTSLSKVLKEVRTQTKVRFTYNSELVGRQQPVTISVSAVTLREFLQQLLTNTGLEFTEEMGGIIIYEKKAETTVPGVKLSVVLRGQVTDPQGIPLAGVNIRGLESREMTATGNDGMFMLVAKEKENVNFSLIGMKSYTYKATTSNQELLVIKMDTVVREIQEVVVNGYQKIDPRLSTGSYMKLNAAEILQPGAPSIDRMLQGKVPGLMVLNTSGGVNAKPTMRIRGTSTLIGNAAPLIVIDGMIRPDPAKINPGQLSNILSDAANSNFELMGNAISGINPFDIESLTFLRDAAATAIYGTRAANGIIVITTKRGKAGNTQLNYNANISFQAKPSYNNLQLMNSRERILLTKQMNEDKVIYGVGTSGFEEEVSYNGLLLALYGRRITEAEFQQKVAALETINTDWFKVLFRDQFSTNHSLSLSGGVGKTTYYASANYIANNGAAKLDGNRNYGATLNIRTELGKRIAMDVTLQSNVRTSTGYYQSLNPLTYALQTSRTVDPDVFYPFSRRASLGESTADLARGTNVYKWNMKKELENTENNTKTRSTTLNLSLDYKIGRGWYFRNLSNIILDDVDGFSAAYEQSSGIAQLRGWDYGTTPTPDVVANTPIPAGGIAQMTNTSNITWGIRNSLDYSKSLFNNRDQFNFTLGNEIRSESTEGTFSMQPGYFPERGKVFYPTDAGRREYSRTSIVDALSNSLSYYGVVAYNLMNRYVINGTIRTDGSNRFGQYSNSKFLPNYVISGRWNTAGENWFPAGGWLSDMQWRVSFGTQGGVVEAVSPNLIATYKDVIIAGALATVPILSIKSLPYPNLRWEKTYQWNIGTNLAFFNNRVRLGLEYYKKKSVDVLDMVQIAAEYGMAAMYRNSTELRNAGMEAMLGVDIIKKKYTTFSISVISSRNLNMKDDQVTVTELGAFLSGRSPLPGRPVSGFYSYAYKGLNPSNGLPMFNKLERDTKTSDPNDFLVYSGQLQPTVTLSMQPSFRYRSFTVSTLFYLSLGSTKRLNTPFATTNIANTVPSPFTNVDREYLSRWRKPGDEVYTNIPVLVDNIPYSDYIKIPYGGKQNVVGTTQQYTINPLIVYSMSDFWTVKNDYLRCNYVNFGYTIPAKILAGTGIKNLIAGFTVNNPFIFANKRLKGQDPEIDGTGGLALPITRQYAFSVSAGF